MVWSVNLLPGFAVNGLIAWAAYALPSGSYERMEGYISTKLEEMDSNIKINKNGYKSATFNCMDFSVAVLNTVIDIHHPILHNPHHLLAISLIKDPKIQLGALAVYALISSVDHPNDHIQFFMDHAHDAGIFDDRKYRGEPEAVSNKPQVAVKSMRHHKTLDFFLSMEKLRVK